MRKGGNILAESRQYYGGYPGAYMPYGYPQQYHTGYPYGHHYGYHHGHYHHYPHTHGYYGHGGYGQYSGGYGYREEK